MLKLKEICAKAVNKLAHEAKDAKVVEYKEKLLIKIRETAEQGYFHYDVNCFGCPDSCWKEISEWLISLGFVIYEHMNFTATIKWDDVSIAEIEMKTKPKPAVTTFDKVSRIEFGWNYDTTRYDFVCSCCNEHSEYTSNYCPHCGAKMYVPNGGKRRDY